MNIHKTYIELAISTRILLHAVAAVNVGIARKDMLNRSNVQHLYTVELTQGLAIKNINKAGFKILGAQVENFLIIYSCFFSNRNMNLKKMQEGNLNLWEENICKKLWGPWAVTKTKIQPRILNSSHIKSSGIAA